MRASILFLNLSKICTRPRRLKSAWTSKLDFDKINLTWRLNPRWDPMIIIHSSCLRFRLLFVSLSQSFFQLFTVFSVRKSADYWVELPSRPPASSDNSVISWCVNNKSWKTSWKIVKKRWNWRKSSMSIW